jgi:hypothetical protein
MDRLDHPFAPALVALVYAWLAVAIHTAPQGGDPSALVRAAPPWTDPSAAPAGLRVVEKGYDGQFYYRLALDPFTDRVTGHGITFDDAPYRQQRIVYPLLAAAVAAGDERRAPLALVLVNVAALVVIGWVGGMLARASGRHALWGAAFVVYPGFVVSLLSDLTEIVAAAFLLAGIATLRAGRVASGAAVMTAGALARESTALFAAIAALVRLREAPARPRRWLPLLLPVAALAMWQAALAMRWGAAPASAYPVTFVVPGLGPLVGAWWNPERYVGIQSAVWLAVVAFVLLVIFLGARALRSASPAERFAWLAYAVVTLSVNPNFWANSGVLRPASELGMLTTLMTLGAGVRPRTVVLVAGLALSALLVGTGLPI